MSELTTGPVSDSAWDAYVGQHPAGHHEQSSGFGHHRERHGFSVSRLGVFEHGKLVGGAQIVFRNAPLIGRLGTVPQGPLVDDQRIDGAAALIKAIRTQAQELQISRLRVISYAEPEFWSTLLSDFGFAPSGYRWPAGETALVRIDRGNDAILAAMKPKCRYNLRLAQRKGVRVVQGEVGDLETFYRLHQITAERQKFPIFPLQYFKDTWQVFAPQKKIKLFFAYSDDDTPLAAILVTVMGNRAYYGWGGLSNEKPELMANYLTHWEAIQWARDAGCEIYDFAGVDGDDGVARFKKQWGGDLVHYPDALDSYYGFFAGAIEAASAIAWDNPRLRDLTWKLSYRLYGSIPH
ncbi:MAG: lipid II:glycine glycyltransferase FemX [Thiotrichales bacterium]